MPSNSPERSRLPSEGLLPLSKTGNSPSPLRLVKFDHSAALAAYEARLQAVLHSPEIQRGLKVASEVGRIAETVLYEAGVTHLWLPPIDSSIHEYGGKDFEVFNPINGKTYSLIQSPQVMKEAAAIVFGSNWRRATCFRAEPGDKTHGQMFEQIDVELQDAEGRQAMRLIEAILRKAHFGIKGRNLAPIPKYDYLTFVKIYGKDDPNLFSGILLDIVDKTPVLRGELGFLSSGDLRKLAFHRGLHRFSEGGLGELHGRIRPQELLLAGTDLNHLRELRDELSIIHQGLEHADEIRAYWLINMPFAVTTPTGGIRPLHHIMTMPRQALLGSPFSFFDYNDKALTELRCDSYDLVVCTKSQAVEVAGGDRRMNTATLQRQALERFHLPVSEFAFLLQALTVNERSERPCQLAGFAFGLERLCMLLGGLDSIDKVQLFPANSPNGEMVHAVGSGRVACKAKSVEMPKRK